MASTYTGGLSVTKRMREILKQPGYLSSANGGQTLRNLYQDQSMNFNPTLLSDFGISCCFGVLDAVKQAVESGSAPDLSTTETPFKFGYATLIVAGAQRTRGGPPGSMHHLEVMKYLLSKGMAPDIEDIVGFTALHHATTSPAAQLDLARALLECGANVNHRSRYGEVAIFGAFQLNGIGAIDLLMEFGASLDIADADNITPLSFYISCGPQVTATVRKWIRKRNGEEAPRDEKRCLNCGKDGSQVALKNCAKCQVARYCSVECQRSHWSTHKKSCQPFSASNTVVLKPYYERSGHTMPIADLKRNMMGYPTPEAPANHKRAAHTPKSVASGSDSKNMIIKVQVPFSLTSGAASTGGHGNFFVYDKKRDFVCGIRRIDNPAGYDRLGQVIREKGVGGAKAYFAAELKTEDELVIKVTEVLAEQPF